MTKLLSLTAATSLFIAGSALAGQVETADVAPQAETTQTLANGAKIVTIDNQPTAVLGVIEQNGETLYRIEASNGTEFVNHVPDSLLEVTTDVDVVDTYEFEYQGRTYTNKVVADTTAIDG